MATNSPAADLAQLLEALEQQGVHNTDISECLKANELPAYWGWKKLKEFLPELSPEKATLAVQKLSALLLNRVFCGEKELQIFPLDDVELADVFDALATIEPGNSPYSAKFPQALSPTQLSQVQGTLTLAKKFLHENGDISLVLCGVKSEYDRQTYTMNEVAPEVRRAFDGYDSFIAVQKRQYQIFEVIIFRRGYKRIEVLIDQPSRMQSKETVEDRCIEIFGALAGQCRTFNQLYENNSPLNLYSCINSIYRNNNEGKVKNIAFRSPSRSNKRETMNSEDDLRLDDFHAAGILKVVTITVYDLLIVWHNLLDGAGNNTGIASAHIKTPIGSLSVEGGYVRSATVKSKKIESIATVANKLISYSSS